MTKNKKILLLVLLIIIGIFVLLFPRNFPEGKGGVLFYYDDGYQCKCLGIKHTYDYSSEERFRPKICFGIPYKCN